MTKKKLKDLNLLDNFLFGSMVTYPEIGEKFCRELLKTIFHKDFNRLTVIPQKVYYGSDTHLHGTRLDVYLEENTPATPGNVTLYDIEPDKNDDSNSVLALPRRIRFYHAKIDTRSLKSGESYLTLKNVIIIMIMPFDPFSLDRMVYTIQNLCVEEPSMPYDDGAKTIFLYTKGKNGNPREEIRQLLYYMEHTAPQNAVNDSLKEIQQMVNIVKTDEEVSLDYMRLMQDEEFLIRQGRMEEQANTERERLRAEAAEKEVSILKAEIQRLKVALNIHS